MRYTTLVFLAVSVNALQFPFKFPFFKSQQASSANSATFNPNDQPRIAIIGAGAGGSSAAFWISKAKERFGLDVQVDVYERADYIGGRSTVVHPYNNKTYPPIELGASIFVAANKNLWRASNEFGLKRVGFEIGGIGLWDGQDIRFTSSGSWWDSIKFVWRYGYNARHTTQNLVNARVKELMQEYAVGVQPWNSISAFIEALKWNVLVQQSSAEYLDRAGVGKTFSRELVEASTRVNYGQNVDEIHALGGLISMATDDAVGIQGGNFQLFEQFLKRSGANVFLSTPVEKVTRSKAKDNSDFWLVSSKRGEQAYKSVILAAPLHQTNIEFSINHQVPVQPYVHLHVTLLTTAASAPSSEYFKTSSEVPNTMLTTYEGKRNGGMEPEFNSLSYNRLVRGGPGDEKSPKEWNVKIFSKQRVSDDWLKKVFPGGATWVFRKEWDAYPELRANEKFAPIKLDEGLYYVNAFEPVISTMETETIASRNVVDLMLDAQYGTSICGPNKNPGNATANTVYGWDC